MATTERKYFIVRVTFKQVKAVDGSVMTKEDETGVLSMTTGDYAGYYECRRAPADAIGGHHFDAAPTMKAVMKWDGMPWYFRIKNAEVIEVNEVEVRSLDRETLSHGAPQ